LIDPQLGLSCFYYQICTDWDRLCTYFYSKTYVLLTNAKCIRSPWQIQKKVLMNSSKIWSDVW